VPCTPPPFGTLTAVDLDSGDVKWEVPFGRMESSPRCQERTVGIAEPWRIARHGGGVVFAGGALDRRLHAFDELTGAELWSFELPAASTRRDDVRDGGGRQYLVVPQEGTRISRTTPGDFVFAFTLPAKAAARPATIATGHYVGTMILDKTRAPATIDLRIAGLPPRSRSSRRKMQREPHRDDYR